MPLASAADDYADDTSTTGNLALGGQAQGHIEAGWPNDQDWFRITLQKGSTYVFDLLGVNGGGGTLDMRFGGSIGLWDQAGTYLGAAYGGGGLNGDPRLVYTAAASGTYYVGATSGMAGSYTIKAALSGSETHDDYGGTTSDASGQLGTGGQLSGHLEYSQDKDWFSISLQAGKTYDFDLLGAHSLGAGGAASPQLTVLTADGRDVPGAAASGSAAGDVHMSFTPATSGSYYLQASDANNGTGAYTIKAAAQPYADDYGSTPATAANFVFEGPLGAQVKGTIGSSDDLDWFRVSLHGGTPYLFRLQGDYSNGPALAGGLSLLDSNGALLSGGIGYDNFSMLFKPQADGIYYLQMSCASVIGNYTLQAREASTYDNDTLSGTAGNDTIDGDYGTDTVRYQGSSDHFTISKTASGYSVVDKTGAEGSDTLVHIERLQFADHNIALDSDGVAGQAYRIYQAAFDRAPDSAGLGFWIAVMDKGASLGQVAAGFVQSAEFTALFGAAPSHDALITGFYQNVLHRQPDQAGKDYWVHALDSGAGVGAVLASFSESPENQAALAPLIGKGFAYTPYG